MKQLKVQANYTINRNKCKYIVDINIKFVQKGVRHCYFKYKVNVIKWS